MIDQILLDEIVIRLQQAKPLKMFLFGSQVTGTANEDSDIDILLIKESLTSRTKEMIEARKLLSGIGKAFDILVTTSEEFEFYCHEPGSVYREIYEHGTIIYAA
jgi:uncharacterized protein